MEQTILQGGKLLHWKYLNKDIWPSFEYAAATASDHKVELDDYQDLLQPYLLRLCIRGGFLPVRTTLGEPVQIWQRPRLATPPNQFSSLRCHCQHIFYQVFMVLRIRRTIYTELGIRARRKRTGTSAGRNPPLLCMKQHYYVKQNQHQM